MHDQPAIRAALYTVPFGQDFCDATVSAIFDKCGHDPLALNDVLLLLPNNRAIKAMTEAFVRKASPGLLLPKMAAIGDLALDETLGPIIDPLANESGTAILPAINPLQRQVVLANLIAAQKQKNGKRISATEAVRMARQLAATIDALNVEQISWRKFPVLGDEHDLAAHWQNAYGDLLTIWPQYLAILEKSGLQDATNRRNQLLEKLADRIDQRQKNSVVIAAGISTAAPAIAKLLKIIALKPGNMVILPTVDLAMNERNWEQLRPEQADGDKPQLSSNKEAHPQFHLKLLLDRMGFQRTEVSWLSGDGINTPTAITDIFCLPSDTAGWLALPPERKKMAHLREMIADDSAEEALAIAILVRQALAKKEHRIAIVTPDRELALRISTQLKRWGINADDSAGIALLKTANGTLLKSVVQLIAERFAANRLLAVLQHPLVRSGEGRLEWLDKVRSLDLVLRGPSTGAGLIAITQRIELALTKAKGQALEALQELRSWWLAFSELLLPLQVAAERGLGTQLPKIIAMLDAITDGVIWQGANGRQLAAFLEAIEDAKVGEIAGQETEGLPSLLDSLFERQVIRPVYGGHPRVAIYGLLEARLQQADMIICAGLNEGTWPQAAQPDPWLAPHIRRRLLLPGLDRNIGLAAHDLATFIGATDVVVTRAKRDRSGPTVASRFLLRIQAFLGANLQRELAAVQMAKRIDIGKMVLAAARPMPIPSKDQRNIDLSITDFDTLKSDPFAIYAAKILNLRPLDAVDAEPNAAWQGTVIHTLLEDWAKLHNCNPAMLIPLTEQFFDNPALHPTLSAMWQPRVMAGLKWVAAETERLMREEGRHWILAEDEGNIRLAGVKIRGRPDRVDRLADGGLAVIDYKSGSVPTGKKIFNGFALQLGLLGLMLREGGFEEISAEPKAFEYWKLGRREKTSDFGSIKAATTDTPKNAKLLTNDFVDFARDHAIEALQRWINGEEPFTAKLHPDYNNYTDFDQLSRLAEWDGRQPIEGEEAGHD